MEKAFSRMALRRGGSKATSATSNLVKRFLRHFRTALEGAGHIERGPEWTSLLIVITLAEPMLRWVDELGRQTSEQLVAISEASKSADGPVTQVSFIRCSKARTQCRRSVRTRPGCVPNVTTGNTHGIVWSRTR